jgi:methionyl-tRNA formyltransferase
MRVAFAGTPEFAQVALARLHAAGFTIPLVLTQPDRPAGRGMKLQGVCRQGLCERGMAWRWRSTQPAADGKFPDDALAARKQLTVGSTRCASSSPPTG